MSIESLPVELLTHTIALSECPRTVSSALLVCKHFNSAARVHVVPSAWRGFPLMRVLGRHWGTVRRHETLAINTSAGLAVEIVHFNVQTVCEVRADALGGSLKTYNLLDGQLLREYNYNIDDDDKFVLVDATTWYPSGALHKSEVVLSPSENLVQQWDESGLQTEHRNYSFVTDKGGCSTGRGEFVDGDSIYIVKATDGTIDGDELQISAVNGGTLSHLRVGSTNDCAVTNAGQLTPVCLHAGAPNCVSCTEYRSVILLQHAQHRQQHQAH